MLLRKHLQDPRRRLAAGGLSLALGIMLARFGPRLTGGPGRDFADGMIQGASAALMGLSIVLNLTGLIGMRSIRRRKDGSATDLACRG
jgi:hypothetical protein